MADLDRAAAQFREALRRDPNSAIAHYDLAIALKQKDDLEGARVEAQLAVTLDPQLARGLGTALKQNGDLPAAETALREARQRGDLDGSRKVFAEGAKAKATKEAELGRMLQKR